MIKMVDGRLTVNVPMVFANARQLDEKGCQLISTAETLLSIDLSAVEKADSSALAVVLNWLRSASHAAPTPVKIVNAPAGLLSLASLYNVDALLNLNQSSNGER